jgi:4-hydroxy-3-methylbut-2-en-1-yl diphosphate synthase IspG/GcpE
MQRKFAGASFYLVGRSLKTMQLMIITKEALLINIVSSVIDILSSESMGAAIHTIAVFSEKNAQTVDTTIQKLLFTNLNLPAINAMKMLTIRDEIRPDTGRFLCRIF